MIKKTTETIFIYASGRIADTIEVPKENITNREIELAYNNLFNFHKKYYKVINFGNKNIEEVEREALKEARNIYRHNFLMNLPINDIKIIVEYNERNRLLNVKKLKRDQLIIKICETRLYSYREYFKKNLSVIMLHTEQKNLRKIKPSVYILKQNSLGSIFYILNNKIFKNVINKETIIKQYIKLFPILDILQKAYCYFLFIKYQEYLHYLKWDDCFEKKPNIFNEEIGERYPNYYFIKKYLHNECMESDDLKRSHYFNTFQKLRHIKDKKGNYFLPVNIKDMLFHFILYLKSYSTLSRKNNIPFDDKGIIYEEANEQYNLTAQDNRHHFLKVIYHREYKKYVPKWFRNNTMALKQYEKRICEARILEAEILLLPQIMHLRDRNKEDDLVKFDYYIYMLNYKEKLRQKGIIISKDMSNILRDLARFYLRDDGIQMLTLWINTINIFPENLKLPLIFPRDFNYYDNISELDPKVVDKICKGNFRKVFFSYNFAWYTRIDVPFV